MFDVSIHIISANILLAKALEMALPRSKKQGSTIYLAHTLLFVFVLFLFRRVKGYPTEVSEVIVYNSKEWKQLKNHALRLTMSFLQMGKTEVWRDDWCTQLQTGLEAWRTLQCSGVCPTQYKRSSLKKCEITCIRHQHFKGKLEHIKLCLLYLFNIETWRWPGYSR